MRWAGGKTWLIKDLDKYLPQQFNRYIEPFLGGGSIYFHLNPDKAILSDLNNELIEAYTVLKESVDAVIEELKRYENTKDFYYEMRAKKYLNPIDKTARFIYLNQTSFNGIFRVNLKGEYNVPYGFRTKQFLDETTLRRASKALIGARIVAGDFSETIKEVKEGDLIFIDPPYTVTHNENGFIKYNSKLFDLDEQYRLSACIDHIKNMGAFYILTNAAHEKVKEIFSRPDDRMDLVSRASLVGGTGSKRGRYQEMIFSNTRNNG